MGVESTDLYDGSRVDKGYVTKIDLRREVERWVNADPARAGFDRGGVRAERVLNWGWFVASSFRLTGEGRTMHLKLGRAPEQARMRRWYSVRQLLEQRYHAPRILSWVDLPGTGYAGMLFEHLPGEVWDTARDPALAKQIAELLGALHQDRELAETLGDGPRGYRECWELRQKEQFEEDLKSIQAGRPPFISEALLQWMEAETKKVLAAGMVDRAMDGVSHSVCHWDLWAQNVLVDPGGAWRVIDWDMVGVGDEAEDYATVVWPLVNRNPERWPEALGFERDAVFDARMKFYLRAITLDYAIDVLADWVDCDVEEWGEAVREKKREHHEEFLDIYRAVWG